MSSSDELFPSLAKMLAGRFQIQIVQLWAVGMDNRGLLAAELQGMFCQDKTFPQNFLTNPQIAAVVERAAQEQAPVSMRMVEMVFPQSVASFLKRHTIQYCIYFFLGNVVLPSMSAGGAARGSPAPAAIVIFLFLDQPPAQDSVAGLRLTLQNVFTTAAQHGLLQLAPTNMPIQSAGGYELPSFSSLIPQRFEDLARSPLAFSRARLDAPTRRFYVAINGQRDVSELALLTGCNLEQAYVSLQKLLAQRRIELYEPGGNVVERLPPFTTST